MDRGPRILAIAIMLAALGMIFSYSFAKAATFEDRYAGVQTEPVTPPAADNGETTPGGQWSIKVLLFLDGKLSGIINYGKETFDTSDQCKIAIFADKKLQTLATAAEKATLKVDKSAVVSIACALVQ